MKKNQDLKTRFFIGTILILLILLGCVIYTINKTNKYIINKESTTYDSAFYQLTEHVQNVENFLAKSTISTSSQAGAETLTHVWREADVAVSYLSQLPLNIEQLNKTAKFLNQVSEYSYSLSRKNIYNEKLKQEELDNLKLLHEYSLELKNSLDDIADKLNNGEIAWSDIKDNKNNDYTQQVDNISQISFIDIDKNFNQFEGLIYDGAYSEHIELAEKKGLPKEEITQEDAKKAIEKIYDIENIEETKEIDSGNIAVYQYKIKEKDKTPTVDSINK